MGLLEKKWTAIVRLQKKVLELEAKLADAEETIKAPVKLNYVGPLKCLKLCMNMLVFVLMSTFPSRGDPTTRMSSM